MAVRRRATNGRTGDERTSAVLRARDLRGALDLVRRVNEAADPDDFADLATAGLRELIPCDFASYSEINVAAGRTVVFTEPYEVQRDDAEEAFARNLHEHAVALYYAAHGGGPALRMSDFLGDRAFRGSALYDELFRPVDGNFTLSCPLPVPVGRVVGFALVRTHRDFSERERLLLDLLTPHLAGAYQDSFARPAIGLAARSPHAPLVVFARDGSPLYITPGASEILLRTFEHAADGSLPRVVSDWVQDGALQALVVVRGGRRLRVDALGARPAALLLTETEIATAGEVLRGLGLSPREAQVLSLVAEGRTKAQIAGALVISPRTVKKHLESVYAKLGVSSRAAAVSVALRAGLSARSGPVRRA